MSQNNSGGSGGQWGVFSGGTAGIYTTTGNVTYTTAAAGAGYSYTVNTTPWDHQNNNVVIEGNLIVKGKDLGKVLEGIEDRLAIITDANPAKLEKYAALKEAYDHYRLLEKLLYDSETDNKSK